MMNTNAPKRYILLVMSATFLQGSAFVASKTLLHDVQPIWLASMRFSVAAVSLAPFLAPRLLRHQADYRHLMPWPQLVVIGLLQTAGVMAFLNIGLASTTAGKASILMATNPLLVAVLSGRVLNDKVSLYSWLGMSIAFVGVVICIGGGEIVAGTVGRGELLVMAAACCWALSTVLATKFNLHIDAWVVSFWQMLIGSIALALLAVVRDDPFSIPVSSTTWIAFIWLAIPASTGAMGLWFAALRLGGAVRTSGFLFLCPLYTVLIAFALNGELLSINEIIGGVLIGGGVYMVNRGLTRPAVGVVGQLEEPLCRSDAPDATGASEPSGSL